MVLFQRFQYIRGDFSTTNYSPEMYDAITPFYAIFHLPRHEHAALFERMHRCLNPRGRILVTLGTSDMDCDEEAD
jgi:cyclopropane fatty-acyl-phospholipid synthase-like methyltransferase